MASQQKTQETRTQGGKTQDMPREENKRKAKKSTPDGRQQSKYRTALTLA